MRRSTSVQQYKTSLERFKEANSHIKSLFDAHMEFNNDTDEFVRINTHETSSVYFNEEDFKTYYFNYMIDKINNPSLISDDGKTKMSDTDSYNLLQALNACNTIYLDCDFMFKSNISNEKMIEINTNMLEEYFTAWTDELGDMNNKYYFFAFTPSEFTEKEISGFKFKKGGFHIMIFLEKNVEMDIKQRMYNDVRKNIESSFKSSYYNYIFTSTPTTEVVYEKLFDVAPIVSNQILLPFAQKSWNSRKYLLLKHSFDPKAPPLWFIRASVHFRTNDLNTKLTVHAKLPNVIETDEAILKDLNISFEDLGRSTRGERLIIEFMDSLQYLAAENKFWKILANNNYRLKRILLPLIRFTYMTYLLEHDMTTPRDSVFINKITKMLLPLLQITVADDPTSKRGTYSSCVQHVKDYYIKYAIDHKVFNNEHFDSWRQYQAMSYQRKKLLEESIPEHSNEDDEKEQQQLNIQRQIKRNVEDLRIRFKKYYNEWSTFVHECVFKTFSCEILPFRERSSPEDNPREGISFGDFMKTSEDQLFGSPKKGFYKKIVCSWISMYLFVELYRSKSLEEAMRVVVSAFIHSNVMRVTNMKGKVSVYIYNIRQTNDMKCCPYYQWIIDTDDGENIKSWIKMLYVKYIKNELDTEIKTDRLDVMFKLLERSGIEFNYDVKNNVKPLRSFDKDIQTIFRNVIASAPQSLPTELDGATSKYFPMRNGLLEFKKSGDIELKTDNHKFFMSVYTNVVWNEGYNYNCPCFQKVKRMFETIYPREDEREYVSLIMSSVLYGPIEKDLLVILYGTGADGKTTICLALENMLGSEGNSLSVKVKEFGKDVFYKNPNGLAASMKTETLFSSKTKEHDEGGGIQLKNKRMVSLQEPDPNISGGKINFATFKAFTSGSPITQRGIFQKAESFRPNVLYLLQTNIMLEPSEDNIATQRRTVVIKHRTKFATNTTKETMKNYEKVIDADPTLYNELASNHEMWEAMFRYLLPYAQRLVREGYKSLSSIPQPESVRRATKELFCRSSGVAGWMRKNLMKIEGKVIKVVSLVEHMKMKHVQLKRSGGGFLTEHSGEKQNKEILEAIAGFGGSLYRLKDEFYEDGMIGVKQNDDIDNLEGIELETNDELKKKYFTKYALASCNDSYLNDYSDLYLVGYSVKSV